MEDKKMGLNKQVYLHSIDTSDFYTDEEKALSDEKKVLESIIEILKKEYIELADTYKSDREALRERSYKNKEGRKDLIKRVLKVRKVERSKYFEPNVEIKALIKKLNKELNEQSKDFKLKLSEHKGIRKLRNEAFQSEKNVIAMFESNFTRTLNIKGRKTKKKPTQSFAMVRFYYYDIMESIIKNGFEVEISKNQTEKWVYFASSAGMIRNKKGIFIKEKIWKRVKNTLMCGLTVNEINKKEHKAKVDGEPSKYGINPTKYLAYLSLNLTSSEEWDIDLDRVIVVPDVELKFMSNVDKINPKTFEIESDVEEEIEINITDGFGLIQSNLSNKAFQFRMPWAKGLLCPVDIRRYVKDKGLSTKITDIWGCTYDIEENDIQIILTQSQLKLWNYYSSWYDYKEKFKKYKCKAAKLNEEDDSYNTRIGYQMMQSLTDVEDHELEEILQPTVDEIDSIGSSKDVQLEIMGANPEKENRNPLQEALITYPNLLNDPHIKESIKEKRLSLISQAKSGKIKANGSFIYIMPDVTSVMSYMFGGNGEGVLEKGQVATKVETIKKGKCCILRSPHLYREWGIRENVYDPNNEDMNNYFVSNGLYVASIDDLPRLLQYDSDGDQIVVCQGDMLLSVAERHMEGIRPLYYEMAKADPVVLDRKNEVIFNSLITAFGASIGKFSNMVTKVWNSENPDLRVISLICMIGNYEIDYAKTLYKLTIPTHINKAIKQYTNAKVPYFFIHKDENKEGKTEEINNSTVNRIAQFIPDNRIVFKKVADKIDYKQMVAELDDKESKKIDITEELKDKIVDAYKEANKSKRWRIKKEKKSNKEYKPWYIKEVIRDEILDLCECEDRNVSLKVVTNVLVEYLYAKYSPISKTNLWDSFGDQILRNLKWNIEKVKLCKKCTTEIEGKQGQQYCSQCAKDNEEDRKEENAKNSEKKAV